MLNCIVGPILSERKPLVCSGFISRSPARVNVHRSRAREERLDACHRALRRGWTEELLGDERARPGAESGARPRARTDVKEVADGRAMPGLCGERAPEEVLVECERATVGIAALEVAVGSLKIGGRERDALEDRA